MPQPKSRQILVTAALPYANGEIHLGHLLEYIQADIWVRFLQLMGHECHFVCASDAHGSAIMLKAKELGISPEQLIAKMSKSQQQDFANFYINFSQFHSTHSIENRKIASQIYLKLKENGYIKKRVISQAYDKKKQLFLADRFIRGECPKCGEPEQYGDSCEKCGSTYDALELKNPYSVLSHTTPMVKDSEHYFFDLVQFEQALKEWVRAGHLQPQMRNKLNEWFEQGLQDWDISRDAPYFGFEIPGVKSKYFYVWLDAPIGYLASFKRLCQEKNISFDDYWRTDSQAEVYHFIGKDILYFHALFWPAMLMGANYRTPTAIFAHGFLSINGAKMSKSRGTFIMAKTYLEALDPEYLRYYYAFKLSDKITDIDLNFMDFKQRINSDLVGKVVNIASRCSGFVVKKFKQKLCTFVDDQPLYQHFVDEGTKIMAHYQSRNYTTAMRLIMQLADKANQYIDKHKPWQMVKDDSLDEKTHAVVSQGLNLFRVIITYLSPVLPQTAQKAADFLNIKLDWFALEHPLTQHKINTFKPLLPRIEDKSIEQVMQKSKQHIPELEAKQKDGPNSLIDISHFNALDLRVAKIIKAENILGADKLLKLTLDVGELGKKTVFSGIKSYYKTQDLEGELVIFVANLKPRKMPFGISEGMILAAAGTKTLHLLSAGNAKAGMKVS